MRRSAFNPQMARPAAGSRPAPRETGPDARRRLCCAGLAGFGLEGWGLAPLASAANAPLDRLLAATRRPGAPALRPLDPLTGAESGSALSLPTRAHAMVLTTDGCVIAAARRPGEWLLRWCPGQPEARWQWQADDSRRFTGHLALGHDGRRLYSSEIDADGAGRIVLRDPTTLAPLADWPSHGQDPHQLLLDDDGSLLVAHGGLPSQAETGRMAWGREAMDASLVRLHGRSGALLGQWRLPDPRLSPRHLAWGRLRGRRVLGIALQAEHADAARRRAAPVLAWFDGRSLQLADAPADAPALGGYSGDIAYAGTAWYLSCPRADAVACWGEDGQWRGALALPGACALQASADGESLCAAGAGEVLMVRHPPSIGQRRALPPGWLLDNHWLRMPASPSS